MNELLAMGFEHKAVTSALEATGNDIDRAIDILLGSTANDNNNEMGSMEQVQVRIISWSFKLNSLTSQSM